ncbi:MAG: hypothetical protein RLZ98_2768 [Pseudomonadota bacterium]|jgi:CDP-diacylglycerol--glycerol-3-phosphate 3-phosphatidyltransferase/cardiolipin synthase
MDHVAAPARILTIPNLLTIGRIAAVPALVVCMALVPQEAGRWLALGIFAAASATDWLDGYLARIWQQQSELGRMLDPIADKLLVGATLVMLVHDNTIDGMAVYAAVIVLCREILVSGLREYLAGLDVTVHVTWLSKWKTAVQMLALGVFVAGPAGDSILLGLHATGIALLWLAALLTIWTGYGYLRAALSRAIGGYP